MSTEFSFGGEEPSLLCCRCHRHVNTVTKFMVRLSNNIDDVHPVDNPRLIPCTCACRNSTEDHHAYVYDWCPPRLFIISITIVQIIIFICAKSSTAIETNLTNALIYYPNKKTQLWRYFTYCLVHANVDHLVGNVIFQLGLGFFLELVFCWEVIVVYVIAVVSGCVCHVTLSSVPLLGASGGVFGLIAGHVAKVIMNVKEMKQQSAFLPIAGGVMWAALALTFFIEQVVTSATSHTSSISYGAHLGGAICGLLIGFPLFNLKMEPWEKIFVPVCFVVFIALFITAVLVIRFR